MKKQLVITLLENGQVTISGPITDKILSYGMLEIGKELVRTYDPSKPSPLLVPIEVNGSERR